jgi:hypothetical protein
MTCVAETIQIEGKAFVRGSYYSSARLYSLPMPVVRKITIEFPCVLFRHRKILSKKVRKCLHLTERTINIPPVPWNGSITLLQAVNYFACRGGELIPEQRKLFWDYCCTAVQLAVNIFGYSPFVKLKLK